MKQLQNWTICLGMDDNDQALVTQMAAMARHYQPKSIRLLHVIETTEVPEILLKDYPDLHQPETEYYFNRLHEFQREFFNGMEQVEIDIREGRKLRSILTALEEHNTDLIVLGRSSRKRGAVMKKIVRKTSASVLIVPGEMSFPLRHTVIASDFSNHSKRALEIASSLSTALEIPEITVTHVTQDPSKYVGEYLETAYDVEILLEKKQLIKDKLMEYSRHKLAEQIRTANVYSPVRQKLIPAIPGAKKSETLISWIKDSDADFIVLGARGQSFAEAFFLGSFAEDVYSALPHQMILLFKQKGENAAFLKLLTRGE